MASTREIYNKDGRLGYEIRCRPGRDRPECTTRWYPTVGWSDKAIQRELKKVAAKFERDVKSGEIVTHKEQKERKAQEAAETKKIQTLRQYSEKVFMPALEVTCSEHTRDSFQRNLDKHIIPSLGDTKLPEITSVQISELLLNLQKRHGKKKGLSHASCVKIYTILNMLFKKAYMNETIDRNPMDRVERPKPTKAEGKDKEISAYTADELNYILECLEHESIKWKALIRLLLDTGCRRGEALALTWKNINMKESSIVIEKNLCYTPEKGVYVDTPKNGKTRTIYIDPEVMKLLRQLRQEQKAVKIDGYVFTQDKSTEPMHPDSPTRYFRRFGEKYGIEDFHPHKLRHSFASVAITNGADIASVSEKLGHADKGITLKMYTHADAESQKRASEIFRQALQKNG